MSDVPRLNVAEVAIAQGVSERKRENQNGNLETARKHNLRLYAFSPTAGGIFAGKWKSKNDIPPGRFEGDHRIAKLYRQLFLHDNVFDALQSLQTTLAKYEINGIDAALRWLVFHSKLDWDQGDGVISEPRNWSILSHTIVSDSWKLVAKTKSRFNGMQNPW
ncbi:hypothetical protein BT69DRAFT_1322821 [Atractiella rhizophila]|nr:hypothetical protein BT69DRAFT_1322821 [Atractiella rhizophila]